MYNKATSGFKVKAWWHNTLSGTKYGVACSVCHIRCPSTQTCPVIIIGITRSFIPHQICIVLVAVLLKPHKYTTLAVL